jgi:hypothetical protein
MANGELRRTCAQPAGDCVRGYLERKGITVLAGGTAFSWMGLLPEQSEWQRIYESPPLADRSSRPDSAKMNGGAVPRRRTDL